MTQNITLEINKPIYNKINKEWLFLQNKTIILKIIKQINNCLQILKTKYLLKAIFRTSKDNLRHQLKTYRMSLDNKTLINKRVINIYYL